MVFAKTVIFPPGKIRLIDGDGGEEVLWKTEIYGIIRIAESFRDKEGMICGIMHGMMLG